MVTKIIMGRGKEDEVMDILDTDKEADIYKDDDKNIKTKFQNAQEKILAKIK